MRADGRWRGMLIGFEQLQITTCFRSRPRQDQSEVVDQRGFGKFAQGFLMVLDIDHGKQDPEIIFAPERADAGIDVLGVQAVVFETEEQSACCQAQDKVRGDIAVFPWQGADGGEDRISFLARGDEDGGWRRAGREGLGRRLLNYGRSGGGSGLPLVGFLDGRHGSGEVGILAEIVVHFPRGGGGYKVHIILICVGGAK